MRGIETGEEFSVRRAILGEFSVWVIALTVVGAVLTVIGAWDSVRDAGGDRYLGVIPLAVPAVIAVWATLELCWRESDVPHWGIDLLDHVGDGVARLVAEIGGGEALKRHVGGAIVDHCELLHRVARGVRPELHLATDPVRALPSNRPLGELIAKPDLELRTMQSRLSSSTSRDEELPPLLTELVCHLRRDKGRSSEDELQLVDLLQLLAQGFEGEDRER